MLVSFLSRLLLAFWLHSNRQDNIKLIGCQSTWFEVWIIIMAHPTLAHAQTNYHVSQFGHWNQAQADMTNNRYMNYFSNRYIVKLYNLHIFSSSDKGAIAICSSKCDFCMVISLGLHMQGYKLMGWTGFDFFIRDESGAAIGRADAIYLCVWGFLESCLIRLLPGWEVTCGMCDFLGSVSWVSIGWLYVVGADDAAISSICSWMTPGTFNLINL